MGAACSLSAERVGAVRGRLSAESGSASGGAAPPKSPRARLPTPRPRSVARGERTCAARRGGAGRRVRRAQRGRHTWNSEPPRLRAHARCGAGRGPCAARTRDGVARIARAQRRGARAFLGALRWWRGAQQRRLQRARAHVRARISSAVPARARQAQPSARASCSCTESARGGAAAGGFAARTALTRTTLTRTSLTLLNVFFLPHFSFHKCSEEHH